jgi:dimethylaniline monooxygenase (N-oxide forming)
VVEGKPLAPPMRSKLFNGRIEALAPAIERAMAKRFLQSIQEKSYPEMKDHPILNRATRKDVHVDTRIPVYADNLVPLLKTGQVESVQAVDEIIGAHSVRLADGTVLDNIDAVICATGATTDASALLPPQCDPANPNLAPDGFALIPETYRKQRPVLRLYQNWLSLQYPHSLAILGYAVRIQGSFPLGDVVSSAMAQLWSGGYPMPSQAEMERNVDAHYRHVAELLKHGDVMFPGRIPGLEWEHWHDKVAGAGIYDRLGNWWSWESWKVWWTDPELYKLLMGGTSSPHLFRLFETGKGRKRWDGARAAIEKANSAEEETIENWKRQQAEKAKY